MIKIKIFLDSNILIAGLVSTTGASAEILRLAEAKIFRIYISKLVVEESERNFKKKLPKFLPLFHYAIKHLNFEIYRDKTQINSKKSYLFPKAGDQIIFETAIKIKPDYFVTLNRKHFHQPKIRNISPFKIVTPAQFLTKWRNL